MRITTDGPQSINQVERFFTFGDLVLSPVEYQRESAWDMAQKKLLIDSIFRGYDIPKFYFWKIDLTTINTPESYPEGDAKNKYRQILHDKVTQNNDPNPHIFEAIDGQQRLRTILEFMGKNPPNLFVYRGAWNHPFTALVDTPLALGRAFSSLNPQQQLLFESKSLTIVILEDTTIVEVRDMFLRLQNGTPLNAQQKRDALGSNIGRVARELSKKNYLTVSVNFDNLASDYIRLASQMLNLEIRGEIESCTSKTLDKLYARFPSNVIVPQSIIAKSRKVNDILSLIFNTKCPNINRSYALSLYWLVSKILDTYTINPNEYHIIKDNFIRLDTDRLLAAERDYSNPGDDLFENLSDSMSRSTDGKEGIEIRHEIIGQFLFAGINLQQLPNLDPRRAFTNEEKLIIYRRDNGQCHLECNGTICGKLLEYNESVVDHIVPHSAQGETNINNGRLAHKLCNISRGNRNDFDPKSECLKP
jgi:hypothetical protein